MNKLYLLDAYSLIYRAYYGLSRTPRINSKGMNTGAIFGFVNMLYEIISKGGATHVAVAFDHGKTFRHEAYPPYKAQRQETPEDIRKAVPYIKSILEAWHIPVLQADGYEADDVIGAVATAMSKLSTADIMPDETKWTAGNADKKAENAHSESQNGTADETSTTAAMKQNETDGKQKNAVSSAVEIFMVTQDKDYGQLVKPNVFIYKPHQHGGGYDVIGVEEVCQQFQVERPEQVADFLALKGDSADNFPGCPGVGDKTAAALLKEYGTAEGIIEHAAEIKGAVGKKVQQNIDNIKMSKFLSVIVTDIPGLTDDTPTLLHSMRLTDPDTPALAAIFDELEFKSLSKKIIGGGNEDGNASVKGSKNSKTDDNKKGSFLEEFADNGAGTDEKAEISSLNDIPHNYQLIDTLEGVRELCDYFLTTGLLCFDTETTSKNPIEADLVGMSFAVKEGKAWYVSIPGQMDKVAGMMAPALADERIKKVGQNMKFDIEVLAKYGVKVNGEKYDTMIAHYLLQPELRHNMDYMAEILLRYRTIHYDEIVPKGKTMADIPAQQVRDYACEDADVTLKLWRTLEPRLKEQEGLWQLFTDVEMPLVDVLADMELTGVAIDTNALAEVSKLFTERMNDHEQKIYSLAGREFNINSPRQVGEILFGEMHIIDKPKKTKTGQYVTSEEVLTALRGEHEIVAEILDYRALKKLIGTYVDALPKLVNERTGRIHTSFNQCVTATGRLSSSDPNLQNIPVRGEDGKEIRRCFVASVACGSSPAAGKTETSAKAKAEEGYAGSLFDNLFEPASGNVSGTGGDSSETAADGETERCLFFSADYSQIELRVMAHLSQDEKMLEAFRNGYDVHAATAATVYGKERDAVTRDERTKAKRANFGLIYGISAWGLSQNLGIDRKEARALMDGFFMTFPKVKEYMEVSKERVRETGYATTLLHRRRYLPDINSANATVRGFAERNAINAPIQGTAADIIKIAMVRIHKRFEEERLRSKMILQVHDELNFMVYPDERQRVEDIVIHEMEHAYPLSVPLVADHGWGDNWLEAH
ncbi:MAG: DNA polymerase I [Prevotella sp.]